MSSWSDTFFRLYFPDQQERALIECIQAHPEDASLRRIYADFLEEQGRPVSETRAAFLRAGAQDERLDDLRLCVGWEWLSAIGDTRLRLRELQERTAQEAASGGWHDFLKVTGERGLLDIHFQGPNHMGWEGGGNAFDELMEWLVHPELASVLRSVRLDFCPERGFTNGASFVPLDRLSVDQPFDFPWLEVFEVCRNVHGLAIHDYTEHGSIGRLLSKCPALKTLVMPSAPDASFFQAVDNHPLQTLAISAGWYAEHFLLHLSRSTCFPHLRRLEFRDYWQYFLNGWGESCSPFEDYLAFFRSPVMTQLETVILEATSLEQEEMDKLLRIRSEGVKLTLWEGNEAG